MTSLANTLVQRPSRLLRCLPALACLCGLSAVGAALHAADKSAALNISVSIHPVARLQVISQAPALQVSQLDVDRGFIDVLEPVRLSVYSNATAGYSLEVLPVVPLVRSIEIFGLHGQAQLGPGGGLIAQRWSGPRTQALALRFRLGLTGGTRPGIYPWPLHIAVQPLDPGL